MKKENVMILLIVTFLGGFVLGVFGGIGFYVREHGTFGVASRGSDATPPRKTVARPPAGGEIDRPEAVSGMESLSVPENISVLESIVAKEPRDLQALIDLGNLYFDSRQPAKAIDAYGRALAIDPRNADVRTDLGIMCRAIKDYDRAAAEFREAARIDPKHRNSRFNLALVLQEDKKDLRGALAAWQEFLRLEPSGEQAAHARAQLGLLKSLMK